MVLIIYICFLQDKMLLTCCILSPQKCSCAPVCVCVCVHESMILDYPKQGSQFAQVFFRTNWDPDYA